MAGSSSIGSLYNPSTVVVLDYDYTFTTPYSGSETFGTNAERVRGLSNESSCSLQWEDCTEKIDLVALASKEPILFYDEIILYEDELADNGISLLTVKVRVMPSGWFLLLRFWKGYPSDCAAYNDPSTISERLHIIMQKTQKLSIEIPWTRHLNTWYRSRMVSGKEQLQGT